MAKENYDIAIIGGGASGLMLAANLDLAGRRGILLEGTDKLGSKLLVSGGGRCNITHAGSIKDFLNAYGDKGSSLRKCLYKHSNTELMSFFESAGVPLTEENERIYPASMKSKDILDALVTEARSNLWQIETDARVKGLKSGDGRWEIELEELGVIGAARVVIATGGITYPETGSDGSLFAILSKLGLSISEPRSALAPVYVRDYPYAELSGISIPDVTVTAFGSDAACTCNGKAARMRGDLLFTHEGFSGPVMLNISKYAEPSETIRLSYNKELDSLPKRMQAVLKDRAKGPSGDIRTKQLARLLDHDDFTVSSVDPRGMVTAGGVSLEEIDMSTMQIKRFAGDSTLYVVGEAIDADGITGGYNLQLCWSTACTAADSLRE